MGSIQDAADLLGEMAAWHKRRVADDAKGIAGSLWTYGTIYSTSPLQVTLDGDTATHLPATDIGYTPPVGTRVRVVQVLGRIVVLSAPSVGAAGAWVNIVPRSGYVADTTVPPQARYVDGHLDLRGIVRVAAASTNFSGLEVVADLPSSSIPIPPTPVTYRGSGATSATAVPVTLGVDLSVTVASPDVGATAHVDLSAVMPWS